ncbi:MAG: hypothetical protein ABL996_09935 [Micropepsaceae bacterium]
MKLKFALAGAVLATTLASPAFAYPSYGPQTTPAAYSNFRHAAWELVGTRDVSFRVERDTIMVRGNDRSRQIMICVYKQPVRLLDADVRFANGGHQDLFVRNVIGAGQCTRAIDLQGNRRDIRSISLSYKTATGARFENRHRGNDRFGNGFGQSAQVRIYAR